MITFKIMKCEFMLHSPEMFHRLFIHVCHQWFNTFYREILAEERNRQVEEMKRDNRRIQEINWSKFF